MPSSLEATTSIASIDLMSVSGAGDPPHPDAFELVKRERVPCRCSGRGVPGCNRPCSGTSLIPTPAFLWVPPVGGACGAEAPTLSGGRGFDTRRHERGSRVSASVSIAVVNEIGPPLLGSS